MVFKGPAGFSRITNIILNIVMCLALSIIVLWYVQNAPGNEALFILTPLGVFVSLVLSFAVGYFFGDIIPTYVLAQRACTALGIKNRVVVYLICAACLVIVMVTCISFTCAWINNIQTMGFAETVAAWLVSYPALLGAGYLVMLIFLAPAIKIATVISGFDPAQSQPSLEE